ncbi:MAG TPA: hypothetical protein VM013_07735, partial [Dehalococcoidia bacterium]|nr:hypothetical protein [Dehalococcoidia bacterium]
LPGSRLFANPYYSAQIGEDGSLSVEAGGDRPAEAAGFLTVCKDGRVHDSREDVRRIEAYRQGPVFDRYLIEGRLAGAPFRQWITFCHALPRIDVRTEIDFGDGTTFGPPQGDEGHPGEEAEALALNLRSPLRRLFVDSPFFLGDGAGERAVALSIAGLDDDRQRGLAVLSRGRSSYHVDSSTGVLKSVLSPRQTRLSGNRWWERAFMPFTSRLQAMRSAVDYQLPCLGVFLTPPTGNLPPAGSFLMIEPEEAFLSAMFVRQGRVYVRLWNPSPSGVNASVGSGEPLSLRRCSLDLVDEAPVAEAIPLRPWGVQTLRLAGAGET